MNRDFQYELKQILKSPPKNHPNPEKFDGKVFRYDYTSNGTSGGVLLEVSSETTVNVDGLQIFHSRSQYFIPFEQPTEGAISNNILTELIYQHICRETDMIFNVSAAKVVLTPPTLKSILDTLVSGEN